MKLLEKNTRYLLKVLPLVLLGCTLLFFLLLQRQTLHLQKEQLLLKQENVLAELRSHALKENQRVTGEFEIKEVFGKPVADIPVPTDTLIYYPARKAWVSFQMMRTMFNVAGKKFILTTFVSSKEILHLKIAVFGSQLLIYLVLLFAIIRINQRLSDTLWQPFYHTVSVLEQYDIHTQQNPELEKETGINEFDELNQAIRQLSDRNNQAYNNQKQFVENASHEIQTPLAIIRSKTELLMEHPNLSAETIGLIMDIADANNRLSSMNHTLILLSKIQNNQFLERTEVNLFAMVKKNVAILSDYYLERMPLCTLDIEDTVILNANRELLEVMCSNLLRNAVVHNQPSGFIKVGLTSNALVIENTGFPLTIDPQLLFERFKTAHDNRRKTTGLGLAIVKQICELYGYRVAYTYKHRLHSIRIDF